MPMNDLQFLEIAKIVAQTSKCVSLKVGAVLVRDGRIISMGYNGTAPGLKNCSDVWSHRCHEHTEWSNKYEIHAEQNALLFAARNGISTQGSTVYTTIEPCHQCLKLMIAAGVIRVVYLDGYYRETIDSQDKMEFGLECGLILQRYTSESTTP